MIADYDLKNTTVFAKSVLEQECRCYIRKSTALLSMVLLKNGLKPSLPDTAKYAMKLLPSAQPTLTTTTQQNLVRGILCGICNKGLGQFKDSLTNLKSAVSYLESHE